MASPLTEPSTGPRPPGDPGHSIRVWTALFLRVGVGLTLLSSGLAGYFGQRSPMGGVWNMWSQTPWSGMDPFFAALPYLAIGIGLALIMGFLTTASAIASAFFSLAMPIFSIVQIVTAGATGAPGPGGGRWMNDPFSAMMMATVLPGLVPQAALIWLSPMENHPYSIDALIFGRNEIEMAPRFHAPASAPEAPSPEAKPTPTIHIGEGA